MNRVLAWMDLAAIENLIGMNLENPNNRVQLPTSIPRSSVKISMHDLRY
jgi:hypothetical protein